jgi:hypothetical protein
MLASQGHCYTPQRHYMHKTITPPYEPILIRMGHMNALSPNGLRYCMLVIDHHTHYIWVRFLKSKDDTSSELECGHLEIRYLHARHHNSSCTFAPVIKFDSDSVFEAATARHMCARMNVGEQF